MPELPEVETVVRGLQKPLTGNIIRRVVLTRKNLRIPFPRGLASMSDVRISGITRRAKYILIHLDNGRSLIIHLGMSGKLTVSKPVPRIKHDHMIVVLDNRVEVVLNDARRFGLVDLAKTDKLDGHRLFAHLAPDPFDKKFTAKYLIQKLADKKTAIKIAIMDQRIVVGVGNIYAAEALYAARIDPRRTAGDLSNVEVKKLYTAILKILTAAIKSGGSSLRDYVQADGELGYFQHKWAVYGKAGEKCKGCTCKVGVKKITQAGRSTFYCESKQK